MLLLQNRPGVGLAGERYTITEWTPLVPGGRPPRTRFALPAARERGLSVPEAGEKDRDYLFKELYELKGNDLMSWLRSQSPSSPLCPVWSTVSQKKK